MRHIDLFSGIGGFSYAFDQVFHEQKNTHTFVEIDPFCQAVIRRHWPEAEIIGDIRTFGTDEVGVGNSGSDAHLVRRLHRRPQELATKGAYEAQRESIASPDPSPFLVTGGFPCQPFSQAGRRKGTSDNRFLWPEMLRVIRNTSPEWVIAENVRGILTIEQGMVFEQVCADLESAGYEVQPLIIPAVALDAPHRRDRVWFVAHRNERPRRSGNVTEPVETTHSKSGTKDTNDADSSGFGFGARRPKWEGQKWPSASYGDNRNASHSIDPGLERREQHKGTRHAGQRSGKRTDETQDTLAQNTCGERSCGRHHGHRTGEAGGIGPEDKAPRPDTIRDRWREDWLKVATRLCRMDDGIPVRLDELGGHTRSQHRIQRLKALGNAIVPQVAMEIMQAIKSSLTK